MIQIQLRRDTAANWTSVNPILADGEAGYETDTGKIKLGDGVTAWTSLSYRFVGVTDHGALTGLGDDDHTQYHNDSRALTWLGTRSTTDLPEGSNLYFTDERAQDGIGTILVDTASVDLTYNDGVPSITATVLPAGVDHNSLANFDSNKHIDHTAVSVLAGNGLSGGGTIDANKTIDVDLNELTTVTATSSDYVSIVDVSDANISKKALISDITSLVTSGINELTGDVTAGPGTGSQAATIATNAVTFAKFQQIATNSLLGRYTAATGNIEQITIGNNAEFNSSTLNFTRYWKKSVRLASTVALTVTSSGSGVGQTLTATSNGALSLDTTTAATNNRVLIKDQATGSENGIYVVTQVGSAGTPFILTRATDFDGSASGDVQTGDIVSVRGGDANLGVFFYVSTTGSITVGSTSLTFQSNGSGNVFASGAATRVAFFSDTDTLTTNSGFIYSNTNNCLALGTSTSSTARINIANNVTDNAGSYNGALSSSTHTLTTDNSNSFRGWVSSINLAHSTANATATLSAPALEGFRSTVTISSGAAPGVVTALASYNALARNQGGGTLTHNVNYLALAATNSGGGTITNNYCFYAVAQTVGTFNYSFYGATAAATGRFNIYMAGTAFNYLAGNLGVGADANNAANAFAKVAVYGTTSANCRIGWGFSGTYGQTYAAAEFSSVSQNGNTWSLFVNQIPGSSTQVLQFIGNGSSTFLNSISISTAAATIASGTSGNFIAGNNTSTTVPSFIYAQGDTNTGYGRAGADVANVIAGGVEVQRWNGSGDTGIGNTGTISARLHIIKTTEQLRVGYDASNYFSTTVSSAGAVTFNAVGASAGFTFSDPVIADNIVRLKGYTVATLPAGTQGDTAFVTDLLAPTFFAVAVGGGAVVGPVFYDGTNWICT